MPSGQGGMGTGSDTRMYNPRSEASNLYTRDDIDDSKHGFGDPEQLEQMRDKKQAKQEADDKVQNLPHLTVDIDDEPMDMGLPPMSPGEDPQMMGQGENAVGAEISQLTGMPGQAGPDVSTAIGAQTNGVLGGYRPVMTGEPMEAAWSELMKNQKPWGQPQFESTPGGRDIWTANPRRAKGKARELHHEHGKKGGGLMDAPLAVGMEHLSTTNPKRLDVGGYKHWRGQMARQRTQGGISMPRQIQGHGQFGERSTSPNKPVEMPGSESKPMSKPKKIRNVGEPHIKESSITMKAYQDIKGDLEEVQKNMDYLHFSQIRRLLRDLKRKLEAKERAQKAFPTQGEKNEAGHRDGGTTNPQGGTDSIDADENKNMGASGKLFVGLGSGRAA